MGRDVEVEELIEQARVHRLVTLTEAGGVGKTRLALRVAAEVAAEFPGGVWLVELASAGTAEAVLSVMAAGVGLVLQPGRSPEAQLVARLGGRGVTLMVLDNCEHVVEVVARLAEHEQPVRS